MPPQSNSRPAWPSNDDQTIFNLVVILVGSGVGSYLLWQRYHGEISAGVMALRHFEMQLLGHLTDRFEQADQQMTEANPYRVTLRNLYGISQAIGRFWRIPACVFIVVLAVVCMVRAAPSRFRRKFDLDGLAAEQAATFPCTTAFLGRKLKLEAPAKGELLATDYALTAEEWIGRFAADTAGGFDESRARAALQWQLGPRWSGPETASPWVKVLFVAFALHQSERRQDAVDLLGRVSAGLAVGRAPLPLGAVEQLAIPADIVAQASDLIGDPHAFMPSRDAAGGHAYTAPALMTLLNVARRHHGVLAPAQFAWLKLIDRPLWYALHSLGFETEGLGRYLHPNPRVEALGVRDHWAVECAAGEPVYEPDFSRALSALQRHIPSSKSETSTGRRQTSGTAPVREPVRIEAEQSNRAAPTKEITK